MPTIGNESVGSLVSGRGSVVDFADPADAFRCATVPGFAEVVALGRGRAAVCGFFADVLGGSAFAAFATFAAFSDFAAELAFRSSSAREVLRPGVFVPAFFAGFVVGLFFASRLAMTPHRPRAEG
jgi:hypothetical protein